MQAVTVIVNRIQRLQSGSDVVEINLLRVQTPSARLDVILQHLRTRIASVLQLHRFGPNSASHPANHRVFWVDAVAKEETQVRRKIIDVHAATQIILHIGKAVAQRKRQLRNGVRTRLGNVVPADAHAVKIPHLIGDEIMLHITHQPQRKLRTKNTGILRLILLQNIGLNRSANLTQGPRFDLFVFRFLQHVLSRYPQQHQAQTIVSFWQWPVVRRTLQALGRIHRINFGIHLRFQPFCLDVQFTLLINRCIHEEAQQHGRRTVDGHTHRCLWICQIETRIQLLGIV